MTGDIARGVRLGTILLTGVLAVFVCYRVVDGVPAVPASGVPDAPQAAVPVPAQTPIVPAPPVTPASESVPPPPPVSDSGPMIHRHPPRPRPATPPAQTMLASTPGDLDLPDASPAPVSTPVAVAATPPAPVMQKDNPTTPDESGLDDPMPKAPSRGKRWIKAVGRFLKIKRDDQVETQSLRQP